MLNLNWAYQLQEKMTEKQIKALPAGTPIRIKWHEYFKKNSFLVFQRNDEKDWKNEKNFGIRRNYKDGRIVSGFDFEAEEIELVVE